MMLGRVFILVGPAGFSEDVHEIIYAKYLDGQQVP